MDELVTQESESDKLKKLAEAFRKFKDLCNEPPKNPQKNAFTKKNYTPVSEVEIALDEIFYYGWKKEIIEFREIRDSMAVHLRLHFTHPVTGEKDFTDGGGGAPIQKNAQGVQLALPAAISFALKDAADTFGKRFGRDSGRDHAADFNPIVKTKAENVLKEAISRWDASEKNPSKFDEIIKEARKYGVEKEFIAYVKGSKNG